MDNSFVLKSASDEIIESTMNYESDSKTLSLTPNTKLALVSTYTAIINSNITDLSGNSLVQSSWEFTTRDGIWKDTVELSDAGFFPQVSINSKGEAMAIWIDRHPSVNSIFVASKDINNSWSDASKVNIEDLEGYVFYPSIILEDSGEAILWWEQHLPYEDGIVPPLLPTFVYDDFDLYTRKFIPGSGWGIATKVDKSNNYNAYRNDFRLTFQEGYGVWVDRYDNTVEPQRVDNNNADVNLFSRYISQNDDNSFAAWEERGKEDSGINSIMVSQHKEGTGWDTPQILVTGTDSYNKPKISIANDGSAIAYWTKSISDGGIGSDSFWVSNYHSSSGWGEAQKISSNVQGICGPHPGPIDCMGEVSIDKNGNAIAVWKELSFNTDFYHIWTNRYISGKGWGKASQLTAKGDDQYYSYWSLLDLDTNENGNTVLIWEHKDIDQITTVKVKSFE